MTAKNDWREPYYTMIQVISNNSENDWELEFCESIEERLDKNQMLTGKQVEKLEELSEKYD